MPDEAPVTQDQPINAPEAPETDQPTDAQTESFMDFDPAADIPEDADGEWLAKRYGEMNQHFTQRMQEVSSGRRSVEESQALVEGLRDPETMPHYLRLLGVDPTDPETLRRFGLELDEPEEFELDEPDPNERIGQLEQQIAQDRQNREAAEMEQALDGFADQQLEAIEGQWGRKLNEDEDAILRRQAENNLGPDGLPDYAGAAKMLKGILTRNAEEELKRRSEPGRGVPGGKPGGKALNPANDEDRLQLGAAAAERAMASQNA
jgi:hypothetical protein